LWDTPRKVNAPGDALKTLVELIRTQTDDCIPFTFNQDGPGYVNGTGYGRVTKNGRRQHASIAAWELFNGREVPKGLEVRHSCHNPPCVNPKHLSIGTHQQNMQDAIDAGRNVHGSRQPMSKLNEEKVKQIRSLKGLKIRELAAVFGVSQAAICMARSGKSWKHVV